jgi:chromosomal replication initiator protein
MMLTPTALLDGAIKKLTMTKGEFVVSTFFEDLEALAVDGDRLIVKVPTDVVKGVLDSRFSVEVSKIISDLAGTHMSVEFIADPAYLSRYRREAYGVPNEMGRYTFDTFIVGNSNKLAHAAAMAVANAGAQPLGAQGSHSIYNPLFIYGQPGLGKTHLLYAIMEMVAAHRFDKKIIYIKGDDFTNELVDAIGRGTTQEFRDKYRNADLLLVDDVQFIAGKDRTQEEFFHTFNTLYEAGKQMVLTSDRPPKEMLTLQERLTSRFEWGLITDIQPPDLETRMALARSKAAMFDMELLPDVCEYIASRITSNVRQLEGVIKKLAAIRSMLHLPIDMDMAQRAVADVFRESPGLHPTPELILEEVVNFTGVSKENILGSTRSKDVMNARQIFIYLLTQMTDMSLPAIGKYIGKDHSTAIHARDKIARLMETDQNVANTVSDLTKNIRSR